MTKPDSPTTNAPATPFSPAPRLASQTPQTAAPRSLEGLRWAFVALGVGLILLSTKLLNSPSRASAGDGTLAGAIESAMHRNSPSRQSPSQPSGRLIGELIGREYRVRCFAGVPKPTYTVLSLEGSTLAEGLSLEELPKRFPNLDPAKMVLAPSSVRDTNDSYQLMHAEERPTTDR